MKNLSVLLILLFALFSNSAFAADEITAFGSFSWDDGLIESIQKANSLGDLTDLVLTVGENNQNDPVSVKGLNDAKSITDQLEKSLKAFKPVLYGSQSERQRVAFYNEYEYLKKDGSLAYMPQFPVLVQASPIMISGVPFDMTLVFTAHPGYELAYPDSYIRDLDNGMSYPMFLSKITLVSYSPAVANKFKEINQLLHDKYKKFASYDVVFRINSAGGLNDYVADSMGNMITVDSSSRNIHISYTNGSRLQKYEDTYKDHLISLEENSNQGKQDMSSSL